MFFIEENKNNNNELTVQESNIVEHKVEDIKNLIYTIRGKQVMLDSDVAKLFKYETKDLNRNVRNNIKRFPEYYCFQLTEEEYKFLRCKNFTLTKMEEDNIENICPMFLLNMELQC